MACFVCFLSVLTILSYSKLNSWATHLPVDVNKPHTSHDHGEAKLGAVTSMSARCSDIGIDILRKGGNAADAMIATEFCVGVIGLESTGLSGGGFMVIRAPNGTYEAIDFRETAPAAAFEDMYVNDEEASLTGGLASGVPGELRGLQHLYERYGYLPWADLVEPSIRIARDGFIADESLVEVFEGVDNPEFLTEDPAWAVDFAPNGTLLGLGDTLTRKRLAAVLERVAKEGPDVFYEGDIAEATIRALRATNGTMTLDDLKNYHVIEREPMSITYRNFKITSMGAPSGGAVVLSVLKTVEGTHRLDEAIRFAFGARTELGDPAFMSNTTTFDEKLISPEYHTLPVSAYNPSGFESIETPGTSHVVTADASGLSVSLTSTINLWLGSTVMVPETGIIMNNEMNDFSIPGVSNAFGYIPSPANFVRPEKRPLSSMAPVIVEFLSNNTLYYALGGAGGSHIITAVIQGLWNVLDRRMDLYTALDIPRFHDQLIPNNLELNYRYNNATAAFLRGLGHNITCAERGADLNALRRLPNGTFEAVGEPNFAPAAGYAT
ncbi:gamma-glutamyltranspeptidase [Mytilinidion resinicola]|uniref:Gamma-glutamyltranspeptidase n=1 Tax=Mytilinidion resinicola TaxID=574789 RepID=A0A6A6Z120_9PEZI|nr:gamma-glutamyltranspeptidase [Mytilinidion resinicola]KAF2814409.1 gamma-glutamyltranspeptidase [Mytilinidion resinicola]